MSLQSNFQSNPVSSWCRGGNWELTTTPPTADETPVPGQSDPWLDGVYDPTIEATNAYLKFARLARHLWLKDYSPPIQYYAMAMWPEVKRFIESFGHPTHQGPQSFQEWPSLITICVEAARMAVAVKCYQTLIEQSSQHREQLRTLLMKIQSNRYDPLGTFRTDVSTEAGLNREAGRLLSDTLNIGEHSLDGISIQRTYHPHSGFRDGFIFNSLLSLMYLQLNQAIGRGSLLRECEGCDLTFEADRPNQVYHDGFCRGRANARRSYQRRNAKSTTDQEDEK